MSGKAYNLNDQRSQAKFRQANNRYIPQFHQMSKLHSASFRNFHIFFDEFGLFLRNHRPRKHRLTIIRSYRMSSDPWSRPSMEDLKEILEHIGNPTSENSRAVDRLELSVPAEIVTSRGNTVSAVTREISRFGLGMLHRGAIQPGEVTVKMASESRQFDYRVEIKWCIPCEKGMFLSGGEFLAKENTEA
tara:strand:- start:7684 stop:8250 length:567 start_codon:yes stop_codon:yes gene_type:complete